MNLYEIYKHPIDTAYFCGDEDELDKLYDKSYRCYQEISAQVDFVDFFDKDPDIINTL